MNKNEEKFIENGLKIVHTPHGFKTIIVVQSLENPDAELIKAFKSVDCEFVRYVEDVKNFYANLAVKTNNSFVIAKRSFSSVKAPFKIEIWGNEMLYQGEEYKSLADFKVALKTLFPKGEMKFNLVGKELDVFGNPYKKDKSISKIKAHKIKKVGSNG